jgi:3-deoxy-7-phosphoheptulonate synthase
MIIVLKGGAADREINQVEEKIKAYGLMAHISRGVERTIIGAIGDERRMQPEAFEGMECVEKVLRILKPYKIVSRDFQKEDTVLTVRGQKIGGGTVALFAGPCSVEGREMMLGIGREVASSGASFLRGGAFKPRTSPYAFQGMGEEGLKYLSEAREATGLPVVTELMDPRDLLTEVGRLDKPVILKRGLSATIMEWLMSAEYIASEGNRKIILCERGVRTFESATRNTFDVSAIPVVKELSHLPVIADPSHAAGKVRLVEPLSAAAIAAGADGVMVEVHHDPESALSDGPQSLRPEAFREMAARLKGIAAAVGKNLGTS